MKTRSERAQRAIRERMEKELDRPETMTRREWLKLLKSLEMRAPGEGARRSYLAHLRERQLRGIKPCLTDTDVSQHGHPGDGEES
ncbi:MAG: hypothetical protein ACYS22_05110 [Planctomycetota bacterium]|jgi:hypothetical protein